MLEANKLRESAIYEGDERWSFLDWDTYEKINPHPSHFNLDQAIKVSNLLKPKKTILTNLHTDLDYNFLKKNLPKHIRPAYDGLSINI